MNGRIFIFRTGAGHFRIRWTDVDARRHVALCVALYAMFPTPHTVVRLKHNLGFSIRPTAETGERLRQWIAGEFAPEHVIWEERPLESLTSNR